MFQKIGENFSLSGIFDLDMLKDIPEIYHRYGDGFDNIPKDKLCWMTYKGEGSISFTRNTHLFLPEVAEYVVSYLENILDLQLQKERVHFLKTKGDIPPHKDESNRRCCINIGVMNSSASITRCSMVSHVEDFDDNYTPYMCKDGNAYLVNTEKIHSVVCINPEIERFLITYGFGSSFNDIKSKLK